MEVHSTAINAIIVRRDLVPCPEKDWSIAMMKDPADTAMSFTTVR